jgi:hypothetical protein
MSLSPRDQLRADLRAVLPAILRGPVLENRLLKVIDTYVAARDAASSETTAAKPTIEPKTRSTTRKASR